MVVSFLASGLGFLCFVISNKERMKRKYCLKDISSQVRSLSMNDFYSAVSWWFGIWGVCLRTGLLTLLCKLPGERDRVGEHTHLPLFSCLCAQISAQKTMSPVTWKSRMFIPMFPGFHQGDTVSLLAHHWALTCRFISPNYEMGNTQLSQKNPLHLFEPFDQGANWPDCASWPLH